MTLYPLLVPDWRERLSDNARTLGLTRRQTEVALLLVEGWSNREIAYRLSIRTQSAQNIVTAITECIWQSNVEFEDSRSLRSQIVAVLLGLREEMPA